MMGTKLNVVNKLIKFMGGTLKYKSNEYISKLPVKSDMLVIKLLENLIEIFASLSIDTHTINWTDNDHRIVIKWHAT